MFSISQDPKFKKKNSILSISQDTKSSRNICLVSVKTQNFQQKKLYIKYQSRHKIFKKHMFSISQDPKFSTKKKLYIKYQSRHKIFKKHMFSISQDTQSSRNICLVSIKTQNLQETYV